MNIDLKTLEPKKLSLFTVGGYDLRHWIIPLPVTMPFPIMGIDPGKNFGLAYLNGNVADIYVGKLKGNLPQFGEEAFMFANNLPMLFPCQRMGIEGPSYHDNFGQVLLAEVRFAFRLAYVLFRTPCFQYAPQTSRKSIMGNGKIKGSDVLISIPDHGSDALVIALHTYKESLQ